MPVWRPSGDAGRRVGIGFVVLFKSRNPGDVPFIRAACVRRQALHRPIGRKSIMPSPALDRPVVEPDGRGGLDLALKPETFLRCIRSMGCGSAGFSPAGDWVGSEAYQDRERQKTRLRLANSVPSVQIELRPLDLRFAGLDLAAGGRERAVSGELPDDESGSPCPNCSRPLVTKPSSLASRSVRASIAHPSGVFRLPGGTTTPGSRAGRIRWRAIPAVRPGGSRRPIYFQKSRCAHRVVCL